MSLRKLKRKLFTGVLAGMVFTSSAVALAMTYSEGGMFYSEEGDYHVGAYVKYTSNKIGFDKVEFKATIYGPNWDKYTVDYDAYYRDNTGDGYSYYTKWKGWLGVKGSAAHTEFHKSVKESAYCGRHDSFRIRIDMDETYYLIADNKG